MKSSSPESIVKRIDAFENTLERGAGPISVNKRYGLEMMKSYYRNIRVTLST